MPDIRDVLRIALEWSGFTVAVAADGKAALEIVQALLIDLVLLDIKLPGVDGMMLLRHLRAMPIARAKPVILMSAFLTEQERARGLAEGANDYIIKPFHLPEVISKVNHLLG